MNNIYDKINDLKISGQSCVLVTVVEKEGHGPAKVGTKMLVLENGERTGTVGGGALEFAAVKMAKKIFLEKEGILKSYNLDQDDKVIEAENTGMICGGKAKLFYEYIGAREKLYIFGAGHIGEALIYHLKKLDFDITLLDNREEYIKKDFDVSSKICQEYSSVLDNVKVPAGAYFIIATHSHSLDYVVLKKIYQSNWMPKYIGMVASAKKVVLMKKQLEEELNITPDYNPLFSPVGLDIGGTLPHEIAISILAELQAVRFNKKVMHIRDKK